MGIAQKDLKYFAKNKRSKERKDWRKKEKKEVGKYEQPSNSLWFSNIYLALSKLLIYHPIPLKAMKNLMSVNASLIELLHK